MSSLNTYNLVESRDIGCYVGEPLNEAIRKPLKDISLKIFLRGAKKPPFRDAAGGKSKRVQIEIPNVIRSKINWKDIKQAVGAESGYLWGRFVVLATLDDGNKIKFYAGSENEGEIVLERLLKFTASELSTLNIHEERRAGARKKYDAMYKETTRVYPSHMTILNRLKILDQNSGRATREGHKINRQVKIKLFVDNKPDNFEETVNSLFLPSF